MNTREIAAEYRLSHWAQVMRERRESGQSIKTYCREIGISTNTYHYWQRRLRATACEALTARETATPVQANVPSGWAICETEGVYPDVQSGVSIEIGKCRVGVTAETDPELLRQVCQVLTGLC